ncbi:MAG: ligase-associated DNA damage response endonuclease PdeM [Balneolaceae bacterium]|nr:ligase-associated DNA damage response endonuclease PdeM [Balneolaceae bacterium]MBO6546757.1 ligase-associated DNA damage response endonuclease PdeM [Balneolaceae bacterium]MBO6649115.1 ligase-associated DNA damage response endonuclease PdeM [Balneolaceae bacterium]
MNLKEEIEIKFRGQNLILSALKAIYWIEQEALMLSDLHLGKAGHFRKSGIAIPSTINDGNLFRLDALITRFSPNRILFLGDLFHSDKNMEWETFKNWRNKYTQVEMHLVVGNHDFYSPDDYEELGLICSAEIKSEPFLLVHDETTIGNISPLYTVSGHIHPSVRMIGKGRQAKRIPCFYFGESGALLPAFGNLTGTHIVKPSVNDLVFGVIEEQIIKIS